jgi:hypothetical protein
MYPHPAQQEKKIRALENKGNLSTECKNKNTKMVILLQLD